jgi:bifunctional DNase/RNase
LCNNGEKEISIESRTSDAVALALRFGCPIYITEDILDKVGITITPSNVDEGFVDNILEPEKVKYDGYSNDELSKMIDEAVKTEDYEKAAAIRDELERRKKRKT